MKAFAVGVELEPDDRIVAQLGAVVDDVGLDAEADDDDIGFVAGDDRAVQRQLLSRAGAGNAEIHDLPLGLTGQPIQYLYLL